MTEPEPGNAWPRIASEIEHAMSGGAPVAVATVTTGGTAPGAPQAGTRLLVRADGSTEGALGGGALERAVAAEALDQLSARPRVGVQTLWVNDERGAVLRRALATDGDTQVMVQVFERPARLVIVGGGHIGLALATIGEMAGFQVVVLDDREEFADRERFPMAEQVIAGDLGDGLDGLEIDGATYVVLVSRGHQQDEAALRHAVGRGAAYVGMIGSRRRVGVVLGHLLEDGFEREALEAVHTPVGIDIGAETPEEIAVSILAEVIGVRRGGSGQPMSARRGALRRP